MAGDQIYSLSYVHLITCPGLIELQGISQGRFPMSDKDLDISLSALRCTIAEDLHQNRTCTHIFTATTSKNILNRTSKSHEYVCTSERYPATSNIVSGPTHVFSLHLLSGALDSLRASVKSLTLSKCYTLVFDPRLGRIKHHRLCRTPLRD